MTRMIPARAPGPELKMEISMKKQLSAGESLYIIDNDCVM